MRQNLTQEQKSKRSLSGKSRPNKGQQQALLTIFQKTLKCAPSPFLGPF